MSHVFIVSCLAGVLQPSSFPVANTFSNSVVSFGGGGGGGGVRRRTWNKPFSGAGQSGGPPDSDVGRSHSRSSVDVRGGSNSNLAKAAKQVNDARFTKVKDPVKKSTDPRFSKASTATPKKNDAGGGGAKQVKQKMSTRKTEQSNKKAGGGGGGLMEHDDGYLQNAACSSSSSISCMSSCTCSTS